MTNKPNSTRPREPLVGVAGLADATGLPLAWLRREVEAGRLPYLQVGRRRMFDVLQVRDLLAARAKTETVEVAGGAR